MYIRTSGHLGQAEMPGVYGTPCLWDKQNLIPDWDVMGFILVKKNLDDFYVPKFDLRTKHKVWIRNQFVPRIVQSWQTSKPIRTIILVGHTDEPGNLSYNYTLGLNRAKAVCHRIIKEINDRDKGLAKKINIVTFSFGECWPLIKSGKFNRRNRRVEVYATDQELPSQYQSAICTLP